MKIGKRGSLLLAIMLVVSFPLLISAFGKQANAANADGSLTVAEALVSYSNDGSTGTVEGYIVGHATGAKTANFNAPFSNDYNLLIADSPNERDLNKVMDVQVSSSYRAQFGLQSNPGIIGKKVKVTGQFLDYNVFPGLKSPSDLSFVSSSQTPSIADVRALNDNAQATINGVVTSTSGAFGAKGFYVQDDTAGIYVYQNSVDVVPGDQVTVSGTKTTYNGEVEIDSATVDLTGTTSRPAPKELSPSSVTNNDLGSLVKLSAVTVSDLQDVGTNGSFTFNANTGSDQISIFVDDRTGLTKSSVSNGDEIDVTGVVAPYNSGLEIKPTESTDISSSTGSGSGSGTGEKVLFDNTHGETAGAADWVIHGGFSDFANGLKSDGFTVDQLNRSIPFNYGKQAITLAKLQQYNVFIIGEANVPFKASEQQAMLDYVKGGGSIFFIGDHYNSDRNLNCWDSGEIYNGYRRGAWGNPTKGMSTAEADSPAMQGVTSSDWLKNNFGVRFRSNAIGDVTSGETVVAPGDSFGITKGVTTVPMHAGSTLAIINPDIAKGLIYLPKNPPAWSHAVDQGVYDGGGINEGAFAAIAKVGEGKAAFIGDSSPVEDSTPEYLREDDGGTKTGYDGFKSEGQDSTFLIQTVEWLAQQQNYTSFDGKVTLSQATPLLNFEKDPSLSTEPQPEPWTTPPSGYKWYDPSTYAAGSYGSTK